MTITWAHTDIDFIDRISLHKSIVWVGKYVRTATPVTFGLTHADMFVRTQNSQDVIPIHLLIH